MLGQVLSEPNEADERLTALDQAIQLNPRLEDAHDLKAYSLAGREPTTRHGKRARRRCGTISLR